jgi:hypothetical protein
MQQFHHRAHVTVRHGGEESAEHVLLRGQVDPGRRIGVGHRPAGLRCVLAGRVRRAVQRVGDLGERQPECGRGRCRRSSAEGVHVLSVASHGWERH